MTSVEPWPAADDLQLVERATLTAGRDLWHVPGVDRLGVERLRVTDGPSGARGTQFTGDPSVCVPCGSALASTWDRDLVRAVGEVLGDEVRRKGAGVLLAPTVNIHRHPLAGRNFECFSEDPLLTAELAVAYIDGVQSRGVGCCVKHFVANDQEFERMTISAEVDARPLREIYLPPFEAAVQRAGVWSIMSAYNRLHGSYCSENRWLLTELLRDEWGFDGLVMSDWYGTHSNESVVNGLDVEMPGPPQQLGAQLAELVESGTIDEAAVDRAATKVLQLMRRVAEGRPGAPRGEDAGAVVRRAGTRAIVLLENDGILPLDPGAVRSLAVIGPKAARPDIQGGGSAHVDPFYEITPLDGITERASAAGIDVHHEPGVVHLPRLPLTAADLRQPGTDEPGAVLEFFGDLGDAEPAVSGTAPTTRMLWLGKPQDGVPRPFSVRLRADLVAPMTGTWRLQLSAAGEARVLLDGEAIVDNAGQPAGEAFYGAGTAPVGVDHDFEAGRRYGLLIELAAPENGAISGFELSAGPPDVPDPVDRAVAAATAADAAVLVVGTVVPDSEGGDRADMDLPEQQVALIEAVAAANPRTVVLLNTGSPVTADWAARVAAVAQVWYLGQEMGHAVADVLFGDTDAGGRLATTFATRLEDTPAFASYPGTDGKAPYEEGVFVGYRHYDAAKVAPRWCFGHGLSYTRFAYGPVEVASDVDGVATLTVDVTNTGDRAGREVAQVYVHPADSAIARPDQELRDFAAVDLDPGETASLELTLGPRAFSRWDADGGGWVVDPGAYEVRVGSSSRSIHTTTTVTR